MSWADAFLVQAQSDWRVYKSLQSESIEECHKLHYLLMTGEKLAKYHSASHDEPPKPSHYALDGFIKNCNHIPKIRALLGYSNNREGCIHYLKTIRQVALELVKLAPTSDIKNMNVEYPWQNTNGKVMIPCNVDFRVALNIRPTNFNIFVRFIEKFLAYNKA